MGPMKLARDLVCLAGFAAVAIGIGAFDWRVALIVVGSAASASALWGMTHAR